MATLRQHTDLISDGVLRQTNSTLRRERRTIRRTAWIVGEFGQRLQYFLLQPFIRRRLTTTVTSAADSSPEPRTSGDGDETYHANQRTEQRS